MLRADSALLLAAVGAAVFGCVRNKHGPLGDDPGVTSRPGPLPRPLSEWIIGAVALVALAVVVLVVAVIWFVLWSRYGERGAQVQLDVIRTGGTLAALIGGRWRCG